MASTDTILQEAQKDLIESQRFQEVDLLKSLSFQEELYSPLEPLSLSDNLKNEPFDLNEAHRDLEDPLNLYYNQKQTVLKTENEDLQQTFQQEEDMNVSYNLQKSTALQDNIQDPAYLFEAQLDLQDPLRLKKDLPSPKEEGPDSLEWDPLIEPTSISQNDLKDTAIIQDNIQEPADLFEAQLDLQDPLRLKKDLPSPKEEGPDSLEWDPLIVPPSISQNYLKDIAIIQKDINKLQSLKRDPQDPHGFELDHLYESITLQDENIQQPISLQDSLPQQSISMDNDTQDPLSLQEYRSVHYSSPPDLRKFTLGLNEDDNGPKEYYGPQRPDSEKYESLNTYMTPKILHKSNKLKQFDHYLVEFDDDEVLVQKCNTLNNNENNSENLQMQKKKNENKRKSLSRKTKMYITSGNFKRGENHNICKEPKLMSKNTIPEIVNISKSIENPKKTKVVIKGLENIKKSDIGGLMDHISNSITVNAISTALNEHLYLKKSKAIPTKDFSNLPYCNVEPSILRQMAVQAGLLTLNEVLDQGVLDITNHATVQLGQILTFSLYFHKNIRKLAQAAWHSQPVASITNSVQDITPEVPSHLAVGTCLVALTDQMEGATLDETWVGLGCLGLTYLYQVARNNSRVKESKENVKQ